MAICGGAPLAIEDAGDHGIGIEGRQAAHERDRILIGAYRGRPRARQRQINLSERAALPAQGEARRGLVALDLDNDFLEQRPQQLLSVALRRGCGMPNGGQVSSEREQTTVLILGERPWTRLFAARKLGLGGFERAQALLPFALKAASDQAVVGIDGTVAALGAARFIACPLDAETPLPERGLAIGLEPLRGGDSGGELCRLEGGDEGPRDSLVDLDAADIEAIDAAALDQDLAGTMIPWRGAASAIVCVQAASAVPAGAKALQQSAPFPHGASRFVRSGAGILGDAILVGLIGPPIDEARMMVRNKHLPLGARQFSNTLFADARCIQHRLPT